MSEVVVEDPCVLPMDYPEGRGPDVYLIMSNDGKRIVLVLMCVCV